MRVCPQRRKLTPHGQREGRRLSGALSFAGTQKWEKKATAPSKLADGLWRVVIDRELDSTSVWWAVLESMPLQPFFFVSELTRTVQRVVLVDINRTRCLWLIYLLGILSCQWDWPNCAFMQTVDFRLGSFFGRFYRAQSWVSNLGNRGEKTTKRQGNQRTPLAPGEEREREKKIGPRWRYLFLRRMRIAVTGRPRTGR